VKKKEKIFQEAKDAMSDSDKLGDLVTRSAEKLKKLATNTPEWKEFRSKSNILIRMVKSHVTGEYKAFSPSSLILVVFALIYFITPTDAIPDFIPAIGFTDDASVLFMIYRKLNKDIERFLTWSGPK